MSKTKIIVILSVILLVSTSLSIILLKPFDTEVNASLYWHIDFKGHPWYIAPMQGKTVELYNGSTYYVHSDYWDSCEHNPEQGHLIGIGSYNQTALDERIILDRDVATRNYTATHQLIIWENASFSVCVI